VYIQNTGHKMYFDTDIVLKII